MAGEYELITLCFMLYLMLIRKTAGYIMRDMYIAITVAVVVVTVQINILIIVIVKCFVAFFKRFQNNCAIFIQNVDLKMSGE